MVYICNKIAYVFTKLPYYYNFDACFYKKIYNFYSRYIEKHNLIVNHHMNHDYSQQSKLRLMKTVPTMVLTAQILLLDGNLGSEGLQKIGFLCPA